MHTEQKARCRLGRGLVVALALLTLGLRLSADQATVASYWTHGKQGGGFREQPGPTAPTSTPPIMWIAPEGSVADVICRDYSQLIHDATDWNFLRDSGWGQDSYLSAPGYGLANSGYATAYDHWLNLANRGLVHPGDHNVPLGGLAFYYNRIGGHVMISEGNGLFVSTGPRVYETGFSSIFGSYLGWAYANPEYPGR